MTRSDEILNAAETTFKMDIPESFKGNLMYRSLDDLRHAFILGAMWADDNPYAESCVQDNDVDSIDIID